MSEPRSVWMQAIRANRELALNKRKGEAAFGELLQTYPKDGMVYYERGEAYEYLKEYALAESDYKTASEFLFAEHWREVARQALVRIHGIQQSGIAKQPQDMKWRLFHTIHSLPYLDHEIRADSISALIRLDSEPHSTALLLRTCLESLVLILLDTNNIKYSDFDDLERLIALLEEFRVVSSPMRQQMDEIRRLGNKAAHPRKRRYIRSYTPSATAFIEVAVWANEYLRLKRSK